MLEDIAKLDALTWLAEQLGALARGALQRRRYAAMKEQARAERQRAEEEARAREEEQARQEEARVAREQREQERREAGAATSLQALWRGARGRA